MLAICTSLRTSTEHLRPKPDFLLCGQLAFFRLKGFQIAHNLVDLFLNIKKVVCDLFVLVTPSQLPFREGRGRERFAAVANVTVLL